MLPTSILRWQWLEVRTAGRRRVLEAALPLALALPILGGAGQSSTSRTGAILLLTLPAAFLTALRTRDFVAAGLPSKFRESVPGIPGRFALALLGELALRMLQSLPLVLATLLSLQFPPARWLSLLALQAAGLGSMVFLGVAGGVLGASLIEAVLYTLVLALGTLFACGLFGTAGIPGFAHAMLAWLLPASAWIHELRGEALPPQGFSELWPPLVGTLLWLFLAQVLLWRRTARIS